MTPDERRAIRDKCDALLVDFDARHPEIIYAIECREVLRGETGKGYVEPSNADIEHTAGEAPAQVGPSRPGLTTTALFSSREGKSRVALKVGGVGGEAT
jgi:hypothetical protein